METGCLDDDTIGALVEDSLHDDARAAARAHLDECERCGALVAELVRAYQLVPGRGAVASGDSPDSSPAAATANPHSQRWLRRGTDLGRYIILDRLGGGGMGDVYAAYDPELDRKLAIKLLHPEAAATVEGPAMLIREAQAMARLQHPNVVAVYDIGTFQLQLFVAMELLDGMTLSRWLEQRPRSVGEVLDVFVPAGRALAAAHAAGIVHRDFKPDNVMITSDGRVRVLDFGLARAAGGGGLPRAAPSPAEPRGVAVERGTDGVLTRTGALVGTPSHMSPEQWRKQPADARSDQFSYCVALWEALFGARPFQAQTLPELGTRVLAGELPPVDSDGKVPAWLREVVARGLRVDAAARHPSMDALLAALGSDPEARRRKRWRVASFAAGLMVLAGMVAFAAAARAPTALRQCEAAARRVDAVWNDAARARVRSAFRATGRSYAAATAQRIDELLDRYAARWGGARIEACAATRLRGEQSERLMDLRTACLDRRLGELGALVEVFAAGVDVEVLDKAAAAASQLISVDGCADTQALAATVPPPEAPALRRDVARLRDRLAQANALAQAGKLAAALTATQGIAVDAEPLAYPDVRAEALLQRGELEEETGSWKAAEETLTAALRYAATAHDDLLLARTWHELIYLVGNDEQRAADALLMATAADAAIVRAGDPAEVRAALESDLSAIFAVQRRVRESVEHAERALAISEATFGRDDIHVAKALRNLSASLTDAGNYDAALAMNERALQLWKKLLGPEHPLVGNALKGIGIALFDQGRFSEAREREEQALAILQRALGPQHHSVAPCLLALGNVSHGLGKHEQEHEYYARALAIAEHALGPAHPQVSDELLNLGVAATELGKHEEAEPLLRRALAIREKAYGPDNAGLVDPLDALAVVEVAHGRAREALAHAERAVAILGKSDAPATVFVHARFILAKALWAAGGSRERARARTLALAARAALAKAGAGSKQDCAEVDEWLRPRR
jgi:serine/threonine-protein kinase